VGPTAPGKAVQVDPIEPTLRAPGSKRSKLNEDTLLSSLAFKFKLGRYSLARDCGDMVPNWARTVGAFVDGLSVWQQKEWDTRLRRVHRSSLEELKATLRAEGEHKIGRCRLTPMFTPG